MAKINKQEVLKYFLIALIFVLAIKSKFNDYILPTSIVFYLAFAYCGLKLIIISPLYIASCFINGLSLETILYALIPIIVFLLIKYVYFLTKNKMPKWMYFISLIISIFPIIFIKNSIDEKIYIVISILILAISLYVVMSAAFAIIKRGSIYSLSIDEMACLYITIAILSLGLYGYSFKYFNFLRVVLTFVTLFFVASKDIQNGVIFSSAIALGETLAIYDSAIVGASILCFLGTYIFRNLNKLVYSIANFLLIILCGLYLSSYVGFSIFQLISSLVGIGIFLLIPKKKMESISLLNTNNLSLDGIIRRDRYSIVKKLNMAEGIMYELATSFKSGMQGVNKREDVINDLSKNIVLYTCAVCPNKDNCFNLHSASPEVCMRTIVDIGIINVDNIKDNLPTFFNTRCVYKQKLISSAISIIKNYQEGVDKLNKEKQDNRFLAIQLVGIGSIINNISKKIKEYPILNDDLYKIVKAELGYNNIICYEALFLNKKDKNEVIIIVRKKDKDNPKIIDVLNENLKDKLYRVEENSVQGDKVCIYYESIPKYDIAYYDMVYSKQGALKCGDSHSIIKIKEDKVLIILCDGMGSGLNAQNASVKTLNLVQDFYRAGLDDPKALVLINKALSYVDKDNFTALDMCVLDLNYGNIDFIKSGAVPSFIKRKNEVLVVDSGALPLGIIDSARPIVNREVLSINDIVVLISDGILDVLKVDGIKEILQKLTSYNPKTVCEEIIGQAEKLGLKDDSSIIVFKMFKNI